MIIKAFEKLDAVKESKDGKKTYDFKKLRRKIKGFRIPMFSFEIPEKDLSFFQPTKFGHDFSKGMKESDVDNVDLLLVGEPSVKQIKNNLVELTIGNEKSSIEWNPTLHSQSKDHALDKHRMMICFLFDDRNHTFRRLHQLQIRDMARV